MKLRILPTLAIASLALASCGEAEKDHTADEATTDTATEVVSETYTADAAASTVAWKGEVAGVYGHNGVVNLQSGTLTLEGDKLTGGEFVVDMSVITALDSASYTDEEHHRITDLQGHLTTGDFFNTAEFPTSKFVITSVEGTAVTGNLTGRDKTNEETIEIESIEVADGTTTIKGVLVFDRQK